LEERSNVRVVSDEDKATHGDRLVEVDLGEKTVMSERPWGTI
jgi:hypothetical protein